MNSFSLNLLNRGQSNITINTITNGLTFYIYSGYMNDVVTYFNNNTNYVTAPNNGSSTLFDNLKDATNNINNTVIDGDYYSVQWLGYFKSNYTGNWNFSLTSDDCSYFWIGNNAISGYTTANANINNGGAHGNVTVTSGNIYLVNGYFYPIRIQYGENGGGATLVFNFFNTIMTSTNNGYGFLYTIT